MMSTPRATHLSFLLPDGRVLVTGGWTQPPNVLTPTTTVEIYVPIADSWSDSSKLRVARGAPNGVMFANGSILIVGGGDGITQLATAELYDSVTGIWNFTGSLSNSRSGSTITLLADGRVLVVGGGNASGLLSSAEVYTP